MTDLIQKFRKIPDMHDNHLDMEIHQWIYPRITYKVYAHLKYLAETNKNPARASMISVHYVLLFAHTSEHKCSLAINVRAVVRGERAQARHSRASANTSEHKRGTREA